MKEIISSELHELFPFLRELIDDSSFSTIMKKNLLKGTKVFDEGDPCGGVAFLLGGCIRVSKVGRNGREVVLYRLRKGDSCILTISSVMGNMSYPASAIVEEDAEVFLLSMQQFKSLMSHNSEIQHYVYKLLSERLLEVMTLIDEIIFKNIDERLLEFLLKYSTHDGDILEITHDEIAIELGTAREVVSRMLKKLERDGLLYLSRGKVKLLQRSDLENILSDS